MRKKLVGTDSTELPLSRFREVESPAKVLSWYSQMRYVAPSFGCGDFGLERYRYMFSSLAIGGMPPFLPNTFDELIMLWMVYPCVKHNKGFLSNSIVKAWASFLFANSAKVGLCKRQQYGRRGKHCLRQAAVWSRSSRSKVRQAVLVGSRAQCLR